MLITIFGLLSYMMIPQQFCRILFNKLRRPISFAASRVRAIDCNLNLVEFGHVNFHLYPLKEDATQSV